ncbi:PTS sugar transporter subunit IIB [Breznakia pachnodae]|jgi:PTS system ascorbate-specific IIB component|uniref:PTS system ascorbate-specific IIB component n=1 Tax=Breznakia pachnodae TaxID=265178 RepID=A0ABU0E0E3_9FIRM|nr:PTS sugar transporter subunit IIB [Breznakia pachnodae]MDQ0360359.1 PTS system ascorbate-specific IIB component [Breznakia pachnodae]
MKHKIQTVCGFGCGSSLMLKMNVESIAKKHGIEIEAFCGDVGTCCSNDCDVIFISKELAERIQDRAKVPLVIFNNFMDKKEVEEKSLAYFDTIK